MPSQSDERTVGWRMPDGSALCCDCDCWPPDGEDITVDDVGDAVCYECGRPVRDARPIDHGLYGHESQDAYDEGFR